MNDTKQKNEPKAGLDEKKKFRVYNNITRGIVGVTTLGVLVGVTLLQDYYGNGRRIRRLQPSFVNPSRLEVKLKDLDHNGKYETVLHYNGKSYLFKLDDQGKPYAQAYKIEPARIAEVKTK